MRPTVRNDVNNIQFIIDTPLPSAVHHDLREQAERFLERYRRHGDDGQVRVHIKRDGPQIGCHVRLSSHKRHYHGWDSEWDVRKAVGEAFHAVSEQCARAHELHH
jgi:ribosome-associated translation inhibitor RaiA